MGKDIVPLVDHRELHQQDEGGRHVVEVVLAVVELGEGRVVQPRVPAVGGGRVTRARVEEGHLALEQLHPHHGKDVVDHLEGGGGQRQRLAAGGQCSCSLRSEATTSQLD